MKKRALTWMIAVGIVTAGTFARAGFSADSTTTKHLTVATVASADTVAPGARVSLVVEIVPKPDMHVYAPGQKDFIPVSLTLAAHDAVKAETARFPAAEKLEVKELGETHLVYTKPFRIVQDVTIAKRALVKGSGTGNSTITVNGTLKYQACDTSICYAPVSVPVTWTLALQGSVPAAVKKHE
jgi:DsbC/DsbD-like thiol-disulfide interchange protein